MNFKFQWDGNHVAPNHRRGIVALFAQIVYE